MYKVSRPYVGYEIVINWLRLFVDVVTMAMVVQGGMCVQSITAIHTTQQLIGCYVGNGVL